MIADDEDTRGLGNRATGGTSRAVGHRATHLAESGVRVRFDLPPFTRPPAFNIADAATWPRTSSEPFLKRVINAPRGMLKLMHISHAAFRGTRHGELKIDVSALATASVMPPAKSLKFIERFMLPLLWYPIGRQHFGDVVNGRRPVDVFWATDGQRFDFTVTLAANVKDASNPRIGTRSFIFIDEHGNDWRGIPGFGKMPDIGFFHELLHAELNSKGLNTGGSEELVRIWEDDYRDARGAVARPKAQQPR